MTETINPADFGMHGLCPHLACKGAAGAKTIMPMDDMFWGDRYGVIEDPFGHRWSIATPNGPPVMGDELVEAMNKAM
ncbi:MAG: VOC family protein [Sphingorhabdus sp.]